MTLFTTAYFPSISYMARFLQEDAPVVEVWETYCKQTYRNRCRVMTANGVESMTVPVVKVNGNHTMTRDILVSTHAPWQHIHSRCLESAYKAAPYFEHYYDYLRPIFEGHFERLIDLNDAALKAVLKMLKVNKEIEHILKWVIDDFESKRGHIALEDDEQTGYRDTQTEKDLAKASRNHPVSDMLFHLK